MRIGDAQKELAWTEDVLHNFIGGVDGQEPFDGLTMGPDGSLYGVTAGGVYGDSLPAVFQLTPGGNLVTLLNTENITCITGTGAGISASGGSGAPICINPNDCSKDGPGGFFLGGGSPPNSGFGDGIVAYPGSGEAGYFDGNVDVVGALTKGGGSFKIDHPLDPANKYLYHSFVESPDMMNIYNGVATLDANGEAVIQMSEWFGVLNRDFRYQLTCMGGFAPVYIAEELSNNQFKIGGGRAGMRISWQITGIRQDAWANAHRIPVEEEKDARLKGFYIHPELYGAPAEKQIEWARHSQMMKRLQQTRQLMKEKQARATPAAALVHGNTN